MAQLVQQFSVQLHEPVLDNTGLEGIYDFKRSWSDTNSEYATFFTALQEQLGLKLDKYKGPVQMFIVESAEKPSLD